MCSAVFFILRFLFEIVMVYQGKNVCKYGCMLFFAFVCRCHGDVICVGHDLNRYFGGGKSAV